MASSLLKTIDESGVTHSSWNGQVNKLRAESGLGATIFNI